MIIWWLLVSVNSYQIIKSLNHNVLIVKDKNNQEWIVFGRGIGFNKKALDCIDDSRIENKYALIDDKKLKQFQKLIIESNELASIMSEWIISEMIKRFGNNYNSYVHISLLDHLNFALKRIKENIVINNFFESELEFIYPNEYEFSLQMVEKIQKELNVILPKSEAGMITLHIHSALHNEKISDTSLIINCVARILNYLEDEYGKLSDDILKNRLIIHLKFALKRSIDKIAIQNNFKDIIKDKYIKSYNLSKKIASIIENEFFLNLDESEIVYLSMHLQNIFNFKEK